MSLYYYWDEVFGWIGQDEGYDYSPAGELGVFTAVFEFAVGYGYDDALSDFVQLPGRLLYC